MIKMEEHVTHEGPHPMGFGMTTHKGPRETCTGPDCGPDVNTEEDTDDAHREDEPSGWVVADFTEQCLRGEHQIVPGDTVRADSDGGWECRGCVDEDNELDPRDAAWRAA